MRLIAHTAYTARRIRARLSTDHGFTMITTIMVLFIVGLLSAAAIAAANGDIRLSRYDQDDKDAQAAAEAGIDDYLAHLSQDSDYWTRCAGEDPARPLGTGNAVNQQFTGTPPGSRRWRTVPGSDTRYSIELIPRPPKPGETNPPTACDINDPIGSMVDGDGNLRIRSTGNVTGKTNSKAVVATFRRRGFLDYLYFTDLENTDPTYLTLNFGNYSTRATDASGNPVSGSPDLATWAGDKCEHHWWGAQALPQNEGRSEMPKWHGQYLSNGTWTPSTGFDLTTAFVCGEIQFASDDQVNGPFHSNDDILIQSGGSPDFGRTGNRDRVEVANISDNDPGWRGSGASPNFRTATGNLTTRARRLDLPPSNSAIKAQAADAYLYTGPTTLVLNGTTMNVTTGGSTTNNVPLPPNGVIHVQNTACTYGYQPDDTKAVDDGCGLVKVSGTYSKDLTVSAEDDIVVMGNLTRTTATNAVLGLVAKNFIRVWHPVTGCSNDAGTPTNVKIDAAILSLAHSFTVDNYNCGSSLGTLTVNGAIAQKHRGIVGTGGGTGYIKNYNYDDRLKYRSPPYFLDPVQASWRVLRQNDQSGAR